MKNPFTNENSNLSNIFHNNIHRKKVESLKVRSTEEFLCQFAWLPCRFFRGRRQGRQPLNNIFCFFCNTLCKTLCIQLQLPSSPAPQLPSSALTARVYGSSGSKDSALTRIPKGSPENRSKGGRNPKKIPKKKRDLKKKEKKFKSIQKLKDQR